MFRALPCSSSGGLRRNCIYAASGINKNFVPQVGDKKLHYDARSTNHRNAKQARQIYQVTIPEAAYIQLRRRPPEDEQGNARNM